MQIRYESCVFLAGLMIGFATVAYGQSPAVDDHNLASEVTALKTENIALREQLNRVEEQQKMLLDVVNDLKRQLGSPTTPTAGDPSSSSQQNFAVKQEPAASVSNNPVPVANEAQPQSDSALQANDNRYRDGIVIWQTPDNASAHPVHGSPSIETRRGDSSRMELPKRRFDRSLRALNKFR